MLNPNNDRLDYGSILSPPYNYELDFAIGTTYSLDLDSLVGVSISLGLSEDTDTALVNNPIFLLEALRATGDKVALFCESGQIHLPTNISKLYILLEQMVFQVSASKIGTKTHYPSFHPKMWLIRYINENEEVLYRFIILSRNLTFDRSWDVTFTMDGYLSDEKTDKNDNLSYFLDYLTDFSTDEYKLNRIKEIKEELKYVNFELNSKDFHDFDFIPEGINEDISIQNYPLFTKKPNDILIMSPFLSTNVIEEFNNRLRDDSNGEYDQALLFTRSESLGKLKNLVKENNLNFEVYTLKDQIVDGESIISEEKQDIYQQDIHAKMYMVRNGKEADLYLGSLNASHNAFNGNIEFMVRLRSTNFKLNVDMLSESLFCGEKGGPESPFQLANLESIVDESEGEGHNLDKIIKEIIRLGLKSKISFNKNYYQINLVFSGYSKFKNKYLTDNFNIFIKPLLSEKITGISDDMSFKKLNKDQLSEFFIFTVEKDDSMVSRVVKVQTEGMPEDREKDVISSVVNNKSAFIRYVAFLLGDNYIISALENDILKSSKGLSTKSSEIKYPVLYEKMLHTACHDPDKFKEIDFLIRTLSNDDVIPEGFEELYNTFKEVIDE